MLHAIFFALQRIFQMLARDKGMVSVRVEQRRVFAVLAFLQCASHGCTTILRAMPGLIHVEICLAMYFGLSAWYLRRLFKNGFRVEDVRRTSAAVDVAEFSFKASVLVPESHAESSVVLQRDRSRAASWSRRPLCRRRFIQVRAHDMLQHDFVRISRHGAGNATHYERESRNVRNGTFQSRLACEARRSAVC